MLFDEVTAPIIQAPLGGGPSTPALSAAVAAAGGFGFLAGGYLDGAQLAADIERLEKLSSRPYGVNLFVPPAEPGDPAAVRRYGRLLEAEARRWGVELGDPVSDDDHWAEKVALLIEHPVPLVSFTFGCPSADLLGQLRQLGTEAWVTVTSPTEAVEAAAAGAQGVVVQGIEAGGHRGGFVDEAGEGDLGLVVALRLVQAAVDLPVVATGGIVDGASVAAVLAAGAVAAAAGTAFLLSPEAGTGGAHRAALAEGGPTAITRAFSGKRARGIVNRFLTEHDGQAPSAYPEVHHLTSPIRGAGRAAGDRDVINLWAGQGHPLVVAEPAGDVVRRLADGGGRSLREAVDRLDRLSGRTAGHLRAPG